jgi:hypothetical protein
LICYNYVNKESDFLTQVKKKRRKEMKVKINYRALCPYDTAPDGTDCYHWYTDEFETNAIKYAGERLLINRDGVAWDSFAMEQINILEIKG